MFKRRNILYCFMFAAIATASVLMAGVPPIVSYQGQLTDAVGDPVPDGDYQISFTVYDAAVGGTSLWSETHTTVPVSSGLFSVFLGSLVPFPGPQPSVRLADFEIWLGITVGADPELTPRSQLASVFFAFSADFADTASFAFQSLWVDSAQFSYFSDNSVHSDTAQFSYTSDNAVNAVYSDTAWYAFSSNWADSAGVVLSIGDDVVSSSQIINHSIQFVDMSDNGASNGQIMKYNGSEWTAANDNGNSYSAGSGLQLVGGVFSVLSGGINSSHITDSTIVGADIAENAVGPKHIRQASVDSSALQNNSIYSSKIADNTIRGVDVENGSLTGVDIADSSIYGSKIHVASLAGVHLGSGTITNREIAPGAVGTSEIADSSIQFIDISPSGATTYGQVMAWNGWSWQILSGSGWSRSGNLIRLVDVGDSVGIGTSSPDAKLEVVGDALMSGKVSVGGDLIVSGNVGIGVATPVEELEVAGTIHAVVTGATERGVYGEATNSADATNHGGYFTAAGVHGIGVYGQGTGTNARGVNGYASNSGNVTNYGGFFTALGRTGNGVLGLATGKRSNGVYGISSGDSAYGGYFWAQGNDGIGIYAEGGSNGYAADFAGWTRTEVLEITGGADLAEPFPISGGDVIENGSLVIIDEENPGELKLSHRAYDTRVAGIVSGAGGINPGLTLTQKDVMRAGQNISLSGRVYCLADASYGPIKPGDLLTTSKTAGHAMKVSDPQRAFGAVIGKAMSTLDKGKGLVLVLVSLQ